MRWIPVAIIALGAGLSATPARAQGPASSETRLQLSSSLVVGGGSSAADEHQAEEGLPFTIGGPSGSSESYTELAGIVWLDPGPVGPGPLVLSVTPSTGDKAGGDLVQVLGAGFAASAAGATSVRFGGLDAAGVAVISDTQIDVVTPRGSNVHGNPLGAVAVEVENSLGASTLEDGYAYLPALTQDAPAAVGGALALTHTGGPNGFWVLVVGVPIPGTAIPIPPLEGALEPLLFLNVLSSTIPLGPAGQSAFTAPIPANPALAGQTFYFQSTELASFAPLAGGFANVLPVFVLP